MAGHLGVETQVASIQVKLYTLSHWHQCTGVLPPLKFNFFHNKTDFYGAFIWDSVEVTQS